MVKFLELLVRELNPVHDFDRVRRSNSFTPDFIENYASEFVNLGYFALNTVKHFVRGGVAGAGLGYVAGQLIGADANQSTHLGLVFGSGFDVAQYFYRFAFCNAVHPVGRGVTDVIRSIRHHFSDSKD